MDRFIGSQQMDEGYSEHPLNPSTSPGYGFSPGTDPATIVSKLRSNPNLPEWLIQHVTNMSVQDKTLLAMELLDELPSSVIAQIVIEHLTPRLYIDFIRYLPPEVCLKILGCLDPLSLLNFAKSCRAWYSLALDRNLWKGLYYREGWKAIEAEIKACEEKANERSLSGGHPQRLRSSEDGHAHKKRALPNPPGQGGDYDTVMTDAGASIRQEPAALEENESSIFGPSSTAAVAPTGITLPMSDLKVRSSTPNYDPKGKGKDKAEFIREESMPEMFPSEAGGLQKSTLLMWDSVHNQYRINWKYLYSLRRRLETNWETGNYTNFQLPHPDYPEEGHGECVYSLQYNAKYLVSGSRDKTLRIWDLHTRRLVRPPLKGHSGSVLCLQFDSDPEEDLLVSGSSDSDVVLWKFSTGAMIQRLRNAHTESVLNVKFDKRILVTCSKDKTIKIFNRRPLHHGEMGYREVEPVARQVKNYNYDSSAMLDQMPVIPAYSMIGILSGHSAAVNAVQIHGHEVVSASGDKGIRVWDWPNQVCTRVILGHNKGIACVQYDGRRIVSGSSDNEVKVFDRLTSVEVASLRSHTGLVRTVQAGFGDLPYSIEEDEAEARKVDQEFFKAKEAGLLESTEGRPRRGRQGNAGSRKPEDITAYGAKVPPGGGGGRYGRIVSGSYDTHIIIWRRDEEGVWKPQHHLKQEMGAAAAKYEDGRLPGSGLGVLSDPTVRAAARRTSRSSAPPSMPAAAAPGRIPPTPQPAQSTLARPSTPPRNAAQSQIIQVESPIIATLTPTAVESYQNLIDTVVPSGPQALAAALASYPTMLTQRAHLQAAIEREPSPFVRSQLRQAVSTALIRTQFEQARQRREAIRNLEDQQQQQAAAASESAAGNSGESASHSPAKTTTGAQLQAQVQSSTAPVIAVGTSGTASAAGAAAAQARAQAQAIAAARAHTAHATLDRAHVHQVHSSLAQSQPQSTPSPPPAAPPAPPQPHPAALAHPQNQTLQVPNLHHHHPHLPPAGAAPNHTNSPSIFKLQFDARRIICCSQTSVIVGWDFCNGDAELVEASRFFGPVE